MLCARDGRFAGSGGYEDDAPNAYDWHSSIANAHGPSVGDLVLLWDKNAALGASVIESISTQPHTKALQHCPSCGSTSIKRRKRRLPLYRCHVAGCGAEFDDPVHSFTDVTLYRSHHAAGWVDLDGSIPAAQVRAAALAPASQHSIRECEGEQLLALVSAGAGSHGLRTLTTAQKTLRGGHRQSLVRMRVGQRDFRRLLFTRFGPICALTGPNHPQALEAAHLYSYASTGEHQNNGGLLLRRDLHRLFDMGLVGIDPGTLRIQLAHELAALNTYDELNGSALHVNLTPTHIRWLRLHWAEHFVPGADAGPTP